jgi:hypothetical protein
MLEWFFGDVVSVRARATIALVRIETEHTAGRDPEMLNGALGFIEATTAPHPKDLEGSGRHNLRQCNGLSWDEAVSVSASRVLPRQPSDGRSAAKTRFGVSVAESP